LLELQPDLKEGFKNTNAYLDNNYTLIQTNINNVYKTPVVNSINDLADTLNVDIQLNNDLIERISNEIDNVEEGIKSKINDINTVVYKK